MDRKLQFAGASVRASQFQPGNFTGRGNEGIKRDLLTSVALWMGAHKLWKQGGGARGLSRTGVQFGGGETCDGQIVGSTVVVSVETLSVTLFPINC